MGYLAWGAFVVVFVGPCVREFSWAAVVGGFVATFVGGFVGTFVGEVSWGAFVGGVVRRFVGEGRWRGVGEAGVGMWECVGGCAAVS